jgi:hypothetical protein
MHGLLVNLFCFFYPQIKALQAKAAEMSHASNVLIETGARTSAAVQTDQSTTAAAEVEMVAAVREQNLLAARVDSLTQQAEKMYVTLMDVEGLFFSRQRVSNFIASVGWILPLHCTLNSVE